MICTVQSTEPPARFESDDITKPKNRAALAQT